jgi:hypothetical protein
MSIGQNDSGPTSNDLLHHLVAKHSLSNLNGKIVAESQECAQNIDDAPAVSIEPDLPV